MKVRESVQLQTVSSAMYDQEVDRDRPPSYQRLKTMVRTHADQMIRTRNFRAPNERIETGVLVKRQKGRMSVWKGRLISMEEDGQCSRRVCSEKSGEILAVCVDVG